MEIRAGGPADLEDCQAIYAWHVLFGTGSFEETPPSLEALTGRFERITGAGWPWLVAADTGGVLGFGYYGQFRDRSAYRFCAEDSLYVRQAAQGRGVGTALLAALLERAAAQGFTEMLAVVGDAENLASIRVHANLGFTEAGVLRRVGFKFGRWLDVLTMQKSLRPEHSQPPVKRATA